MTDNWDIEGKTADELIQQQLEIAKFVDIVPMASSPQYIGGFDIQVCTPDKAIAVLCIFEYSTKKLVESVICEGTVDFPYISGLLAFREIPLFLKVWKKKHLKPDIVAFDGHGIMHPRGIGLASHAGVMFEIPTFGIAKTPIFPVENLPLNEKGSRSLIFYRGNPVGACLRSRSNTKPIFVSAGHKVSLEDAISFSIYFSKFRIPELTRQPDIIARSHC